MVRPKRKLKCRLSPRFMSLDRISQITRRKRNDSGLIRQRLSRRSGVCENSPLRLLDIRGLKLVTIRWCGDKVSLAASQTLLEIIVHGLEVHANEAQYPDSFRFIRLNNAHELSFFDSYQRCVTASMPSIRPAGMTRAHREGLCGAMSRSSHPPPSQKKNFLSLQVTPNYVCAYMRPPDVILFDTRSQMPCSQCSGSWGMGSKYDNVQSCLYQVLPMRL